MADLYDYIKWRGDLSFKQDAVNDVDLACLCQLAVLNAQDLWENKNLTLKEAFDLFAQSGRASEPQGVIIPFDANILFKQMSECARFKDARLSHYVYYAKKDQKTQFCAMRFDLGTDNVVCFSGTDDTIVGWEENFILINDKPTYAQTQAQKYLKSATEELPDLIVAGHSKGGNLAMYSFLHAGTKAAKKIKLCLCIDAPGVSQADFDTPVFDKYGYKLRSLAPQSSIIGRLFVHKESVTVTKSAATGLYQHDCFSWAVSGKNFVTTDSFTEQSDKIDNLIKNILSDMDAETRQNFVRAVFGMLYSTNSLTLTQLQTKRASLLSQYLKLNKADKKLLNGVVADLIKEPAVRHLFFANLKQMRLSKTADEKKQSEFSRQLST